MKAKLLVLLLMLVLSAPSLSNHPPSSGPANSALRNLKCDLKYGAGSDAFFNCVKDIGPPTENEKPI